MKVAIISDIHWGVRDNSDIFLKEYQRFFLDEFFPVLKKQGIKHVLNLGDTWDNPISISPKTWEAFSQCFLPHFEDGTFEMVAVLGNHDVYYRSRNDVNSLRLTMGRIDGIDFADEWLEKDYGGYTVAFCPWINKTNRDELLQKIKDTDADYLMGHFDIAGFEMVKGHVSTSGLSQDIFKKFKGVYSGHFHVRNKIGNITYVSNPFQTNWGDVGLSKGFHILDLKTGKLEAFDNSHSMFHDVRWAGKDTQKADGFAGSYVRLNVGDYGATERTAIDRWVAMAQETAIKVLVIENSIDLITEDVDESVQGTKEIIYEYIDGMIEDFDKEVMKSKFIDLYDRTAATMEVD